MKFEHRVTIPVSRDVLWPLLADVPRAARLLPGVEQVESLENGTYSGTMRIRLGPMGFSFSGTADVVQNEAEGRWTMNAQAKDARVGGGVRAIIEASLTEPSAGATDLHVAADVQFMGRLGQMGQPLIKRKANSMIQEFAEGLKRAVADL